MKNQKLSLNFGRYKDSDLQLKAESILQNIETYTVLFPDPSPSIAELQKAVNDYSIALTAAANLDRLAVAEKRKYRQQLVDLLKQLGLYVMNMAAGSEAIMISSGFSLAKVPVKAQVAKAGNVKLANGINSGDLVTSVKLVKGARIYLHEITPDPVTPESQWQSSISGRTKVTFTNLQPGKKYWARIAAIGSGGQISQSPLSYQYVQ